MTPGIHAEQDVGHRVRGYYSLVAHLSTKDKLDLADLATKTRLRTLNQINAMFGEPPFDGGDIRLQSLNYADASIVNQYQINNGSKAAAPKEEDDGEEE
jgi:hypothetical protein